MQWWWCERLLRTAYCVLRKWLGGHYRPGGKSRPRCSRSTQYAVLGVAVVLAACLPNRTYEAPSNAYRLNTFTVRDDSDRALRGECPRLIESKVPATGEAMLKVEVAPNGEVTKAEVTRSSGDERVDDIFGRLAARLQFDPLPGEDGTVARIRMGYSCGPGDAAVTTMSVMGE